jgi:hypothetical protein
MSGSEHADEFARLAERLHTDGWATHVTVERLVRDWQKLAASVRDYRMTIDDYTNDVTSRDALELVLAWASPNTASVVAPVIESADEQFRGSTVDDGGAAVSRACSPRRGSSSLDTASSLPRLWLRRPKGCTTHELRACAAGRSLMNLCACETFDEPSR